MPSTPVTPTPILMPAPPDGADAHDLAARLAEEMAEQWGDGACPPAEAFLAAHPELWHQPEAAFDLIYEEVCLRRERGEAVRREELLERFPQWHEQLEILLNCQKLLESGPPPRFPQAGETLRDFHLLAELGRGGQGVVFLATQASLADRPVVLKVTPRKGGEHLSLARLQHTHVVPLLSAFDDAGRNLRALCMPFFGGAPLAHLLRTLRGRPFAERTGRHVLDALDECGRDAPVVAPAGRDPARAFLTRASYAQALSWVGACLAEALKYAHERGLLHLDLKPSNVLLTADGQPMLLDFHLAREPVPPNSAAGSRFGGTPAYMSPEQRAALEAAQAGRPVPHGVDGRSDVYSLGVVLYEALGGAFPINPAGSPRPLHECNPQVSPGLSDIVGKCLSADPRQRYDAAGLAADLWAHLNDRSLRGVANRSLKERWRKWRRRRPHVLTFVGLLAAVFLLAAAAVTIGLTHLDHRRGEARTALADGQRLAAARRYAEAAAAFRRGLAQAKSLPGNGDLKQELATSLGRAARAQVAQELHGIVDRFRILYGVEFVPSQELRAVEARCRGFWQRREVILDRLGKELEPDAEQRIEADLLELAVLGADLRVRLAPPAQAAAARAEAIQVLDQAEDLFGPNAVLSFERHTYADALGLNDRGRAAAPAPQTAWEHYALARGLLRTGRLEEAAAHLDRALEAHPNGLWPHFYHGVCCYRMGRHEDAVVAFTFCAGLNPGLAGRLYYNRALAFLGLGRTDRALRDFGRALGLEPGLGEASLNRGIVYLKERRLAEAEADFRRALETGGDPGLVHYNFALLSLAQNDRPAALAHLELSLRSVPDRRAARELYEGLQYGTEPPPQKR